MTGPADGGRLTGGNDGGAVRRGAGVHRRAGGWTPAVHDLLRFLADQGFTGAPRPISLEADVDEVSYLPGETVRDRRPWPAWVHSDGALHQVARWLADYHRIVAAYRPPVPAYWRESHAPPGPDVVIAHNDTAPYNAVWRDERLVGFIDWDMAGPRRRQDDVAWTAFSWVPLHARHVVAAEGFDDFGRRRERLAAFLEGYGAFLTPDQVLLRLVPLIAAQIEIMHQRAEAGDETYRRMIEAGRADDLATAGRELASI